MKYTAERNKKIGDFFRGKKLSQEHKDKIGLKHKDKVISEEHKNILRKKAIERFDKNPKWGFKKGHKTFLSEEHYRSLSKKFKGRKVTWGHKISLGKKGKKIKFSVEGRALAVQKGIRVCMNNKKSDTRPEREFEQLLKQKGIKYEKQIAVPFDSPISVADFYLAESKTVIFIDGDYWHTRQKKITNDWKVNKYLTRCGFNVLRFWEFEILDKNICQKLI